MRTPILLLALFAVYVPCERLAQAQDWQQRVAYEMDVRLQVEQHRLDGHQRLEYWNNSPDTLHKVFYHLYYNAFHPGSMMAERNRVLPDPDSRIVPRIFNLGPDEVGWTRIHRLTQDGKPVPFDVDDTVMEVTLAEPILPGSKVVFEIVFTSQIPLMTRRGGRDSNEGVEFSMSQWYPKLAAYDHRGWHADPYVGREFYAPYGTFDVRLTLPARYVVGATGALQNGDAVGHGYETAPAAAHARAAQRDSLTWHFIAEQVHDFAWVADPDYIHEQIQDEETGVAIHLLYLPDVADQWSRMKQWVPAILQGYSRRIGPYAYPQFTVAQAGDGGMEYPMIIFITGRRSPLSLLGVTSHEAGHQWFYAMIGSNEADYAWMDEGFTDYWSEEVTDPLLGRTGRNHRSAMLRILLLQKWGIFEPLNTPADWYRSNAGYSVGAYGGGEMIATMLGYTMSDSLRDAFFREYYRRYRFRHPDPVAVEQVAEDVSGLQLDWFFDQFLMKTWRLDYAVQSLRSKREGDRWRTTVVLARRDNAVMPVDLRLTLADGTTHYVNVPLTVMQGHKPVPPGWHVAAPWPWTSPRYTLTLDLPARAVSAQIDPFEQTLDANRLNNRPGLPLTTRFLQAPAGDWSSYTVGYRPLVSYAHDYGVGVGMQARGAYLFDDHLLRAMVTLWPSTDRTATDGLDYEFSYARDVRTLGPAADLTVAVRKHLGVMENAITATKVAGRFQAVTPAWQRLGIRLAHQYAPSSRRAFHIGRAPTFPKAHVASARMSFDAGQGEDRFEVGVELGGTINSPARIGRLSAAHFTVEAVKTVGAPRLLGRAHLKFGLGADNLAPQKQFRLGAASVEHAWRHDAFRSTAAAFRDALADAHLAAFDGPGPVAYLLNAAGDPTLDLPGGTPMGTRLLAGTLTATTQPFDEVLLRPLTLGAFSGAGTIWSRTLHRDIAGDLLADAGISLAYDLAQLPGLRRWTDQSDVLSGLQFTARFPLWVSDPSLIDAGSDAVAFRWLIGFTIR